MPVAGTYLVKVKTPMGVQQGKMTLVVDGNSLKGTLESTAGIIAIEDGRVNGNSVAFAAKIKTPFGLMKASVTGSVEGDRFSGVARLPVGSAEINGIRE